MTILVDNREKRSKVIQLLEKFKVPMEFKNLPVGDYIIESENGTICVERKTVDDYINSLLSGHLHTQLYNMSYNFPFSILLVEGLIDEVLLFREIRREVYISSLAGSLYKRAPDGAQGVISLVCLSTYVDTALFLKFLHEKAENYEPRLPKLKRYKVTDEELLIHILSTLPGVGEKRAEKLLKKFGSLKNLVNATPSQLETVEGIGPSLAKRIYNLFNRKFNK